MTRMISMREVHSVRSGLPPQQCGEWDHENSLKDGKVKTPPKSRRCKILATTKGGNLIFQESYARKSVHVLDK